MINNIQPLPTEWDALPSLNPPAVLPPFRVRDTKKQQTDQKKERRAKGEKSTKAPPTNGYGHWIEMQRGEISSEGVLPSYWAVYDGHGGSRCCDYVRQVLHKRVLAAAAELLWDPDPDEKRYCTKV